VNTTDGRSTIDAVIFDIGGVLLDWDPRHLYRTVFDDEEVMERFLHDICSPAWHAPHDLGVSTAGSCTRLVEAHPEYGDEIWAWSTRGEEMVAGAFEETVEILNELTASGTACYALSNMEAETFPLRQARFGFFGLFAGIVISGIEKVAKPDPAIFELLLDRYQLDAHRTLFIDDVAENLRPASALGLATVHFESPGRLRHTLSDLGLLRPGPPKPEMG
jgi:2-haloacid dehalogenase